MRNDWKPSFNQAITFAIQAIDSGKTNEGKAALTWVLEQDPDNSLAWLWMACCVSDEKQKAECFRRVSALQN